MTDDLADTGAIGGRAPVESPCVKIRVIHPEPRPCTGCLRSMEELADCTELSPEARAEVVAALPARRARLARRRGGRAARLKRAAKG